MCLQVTSKQLAVKNPFHPPEKQAGEEREVGEEE